MERRREPHPNPASRKSRLFEETKHEKKKIVSFLLVTH